MHPIQDGVESSTATSINIAAPPVPVACTECRSRHLRCDAEMPVCKRCQREERQCQYALSRRGYKGPRKRPRVESVINSVTDCDPNSNTEKSLTEQKTAAESDYSTNIATFTSATMPQMSQLLTPSTTTPSERTYDLGFNMQKLAEVTMPQSCFNAQTGIGEISRPSGLADNSPDNSPDDMIRSVALVEDHKRMTFKHSLGMYYRYFHDSHPILLPKKLLFSALFDQYPSYLKKVMQFISSHYEYLTSTETFGATIGHELSNETSRDGYMVQALLLFAIALHARDEQTRARQILRSAIEIALDLGMHREGYAVENSQGSRHLAESWRRTVWELYVVDGLLSFHMHEQHRLFNEDIEVLLPCDEVTESDLVSVPNARTLAQFRDRIFAKDEVVYSSAAYRIEAVRVLGTVLGLGDSPYEANSERVEAADASLNGWFLHLPPSKQEVLNQEGKLDEMLFQAHIIMRAGLIYLHRPRSNLIFSIIEETTACTRPEEYVNPISSLHVHATKAIHAANEISNLIALPGPLFMHTPFFICTVTVSAIIHLAAYSVIAYADGGSAMRERIQMATGALKVLSRVWPIAGTILHQVKEVARGVFIFGPQGSSARAGTMDHAAVGDDGGTFTIDDSWLDEIIDHLPEQEGNDLRIPIIQ